MHAEGDSVSGDDVRRAADDACGAFVKRAITRTQAVAHVHGYRRISQDWPWFVIVFGAYVVMIAMAFGWRP